MGNKSSQPWLSPLSFLWLRPTKVERWCEHHEKDCNPGTVPDHLADDHTEHEGICREWTVYIEEFCGQELERRGGGSH